MTEEEWWACRGYHTMLDFVVGHVSDRKLRLLACACCRRPELWRLLQLHRATELVDVTERFADGLASWRDVSSAAEAAPAGRVSGGSWRSPNPVRLPPSGQALRAASFVAALDAADAAWGVAREGVNLLGSTPSDLIRDVFGPLPFRPVAAAPSWRTSTVVALAAGIYAERAFDRLPILADALQDAGCENADVLDHCRGPGPHVRGCWAVDLVLGKA